MSDRPQFVYVIYIRTTAQKLWQTLESKFIEAVSSGWPAILSSLRSLLETGESLEATRRWQENMK
jgi:hypothetical protein